MDRLLYAFLAASLLITTTATGQVLDFDLPGDELPIPAPSGVPLGPADSIAAEAESGTEGTEPADPQPPAVDTQTVPVRELKGVPIQRGPIHEAFAEPLQLTPQPTKVLKKAPPAIIEELPPEASPTAKNMRWISGYWGWDAQRNDYVWVSGVWRKTPKDRTWVAGRWEEVDGGHQWISGTWMKTGPDGEIVEQEVLPLPPKSLEEGPTSPAPSNDHFWIPGIWKHDEEGKYVWRPGFWSRSHRNWVWVPDHNVWTPDGCTFVAGYWDYPWERRGTLYAPCSFGNDDLSGRVCYRPSAVIDTNQWLVNLWVGPGYGHYYYGDYHDHAGLGYSPWYSYYGANRSCYDPFYSYYRWRFPQTYGIGLYGFLHDLHLHYGRHSLSRPSISLHGYHDSHRRSRGYSSLYGNVLDLYGRHGHAAHRDHYGYGVGHSRHDDHYDNRHTRGYDIRSILNSQRKQQERRRLIGYANGQSVYSDRGRGGVTRGDIGTRSAPGITRSQIGTGRSRGRSANTDNLQRMREMMDRRVPALHSTRGPSTARPTTRSPRLSNPSSRNPRAAPKVSRPSAKVPRPAPKVSRPSPKPGRASSPGFSTRGLKTARGADLAKQRAAMNRRMQQRKGN